MRTTDAGTLARLAREAKAGDVAALDDLLAALRPLAVRTARLIVGPGSWAAEDAAQEAMIDVTLGISSLERPEAVRTWACRIAVNRALKAARRERLHAVVPWPSRELAGAALEPRLDGRAAALVAAARALPPRQRAVLVLRLDAGLSEAETAEALGTTAGTVKSQLHDARVRMTAALQAEGIAIPTPAPTNEEALEEIAEALRAAEGHERPIRRRRRTPSPTALRALAAGLGLVVAATIGGLVVLALRSASGGDADCAKTLVWNGIDYRGIAVQAPSTLTFGERVGDGLLLGCSDEPGVAAEPDANEPLRAVEGVRPSVAVAPDDGAPTSFYIAHGRCADAFGWARLERCLRRTLVLDGRLYAQTMFDEAREIARGDLVGTGILRLAGSGERDVAVARLDGIEPARAVAVPELGERLIYIAEGACYVHPAGALLACLRGSEPEG